ncbi:MAG TPA: helix-turn-helix transcriptional regulator [Acidimicrobiia bacterium]|jgi:transcriptional regulator with XRE-family HTH domain|nr:helix-turn-helix transcriptional regulator [Acidimicrobiia bacterium]
MVDPTSTLGRAIRARREELHLSTDDAAVRARIPETSWRLIEQGQQAPSDLMLGAICRALEWTPATIDNLLRNEIHVNPDGEMVVDLDASERAAAPPQPELTLDVRGLTSAQLREVQGYIDYLRERFS